MGDYLRYKSAIGNTLSELPGNRQVSDATLERARARFGAKGVVDMTGIFGYYTFLAMQLNVAQYQVSMDGKKLPRMPGQVEVPG